MATRINIDDIRGTEIQEQARKEGLDHVELLAEIGEGDDRITVYDFSGVLVANTNGGAVWQESDPDGFARLAVVGDREDPRPLAGRAVHSEIAGEFDAFDDYAEADAGQPLVSPEQLAAAQPMAEEVALRVYLEAMVAAGWQLLEGTTYTRPDGVESMRYEPAAVDHIVAEMPQRVVSYRLEHQETYRMLSCCGSIGGL